MTKERRRAIQRVMEAASRYAIEAVCMVGYLDDRTKDFQAQAAKCQAARKRLRRYVLELSR